MKFFSYFRLNNKGRIEYLSCEPVVMTVANNKSTTEEVLAFYEAYQLSKLFNSNSNLVSVHLKPGQIVMMHNTRVLHGRTGFKATPETGTKVSRWLQSTFLEWDMVFSKLRILQKNLGLETPHLYTESNDFF